MFRESVIQYPTFAASAAGNSAQNGAWPACNFAEFVNTAPTLPTAVNPQMSRAIPPASRSGAAKDSKYLTPSTPVRMIATWMIQKTKKVIKACPGTLAQPLQMAVTSASVARPPIQVWIPNQPQATRARAIAAKFAPRTPNEERTKTGNGTPYLVPAWALRSIGIRTRTLPKEMVNNACHQFIPAAMRPDARV
jgi:hypothetical protein